MFRLDTPTNVALAFSAAMGWPLAWVFSGPTLGLPTAALVSCRSAGSSASAAAGRSWRSRLFFSPPVSSC
ncbi:hypothetical protein MZTS_01080 [Methylorubrum zatmanii]|jgi:hypothetical protein|uniref:Uncharacterized protein n=1 Tax=Methylorubrum extorquens (strain ATCC 14718 / DSM 1338 / JCM 2805 / NCIMB 9133 / AM1) TaxID=272630 RepID=C5B3J4_METEA|nr:Hypothetical protein MexAM1_META2p0096 [Methylorubrum extorquens AM1]MBD8905341.1 hypothetical protein [Methylorubrum zatmanii]